MPAELARFLRLLNSQQWTSLNGPCAQEWITHDKGQLHSRKLTDFDTGGVYTPRGVSTIDDFGSITAAMERAGWREGRVRRVLGENWLRVLGEGWGVG